MIKKSFLGLSLILIFVSFVAAQDGGVAKTPEKDSVERMAIMNAIRMPVEKELKQRVQFTIKHIKANDMWAFVMGEPLDLKAAQPNYDGTRYKTAIDAGAFDNNYQALLKKTAGKWKVVNYMIGCTDVCWLDWDKKYKAPKDVFPASEK